MAELALDHPERVLDLRTHARLELLNLVDQRVDLVAFVQRLAPARAQGDGPVHAGPGVRPSGRALVTRIGEDDALLTVLNLVAVRSLRWNTAAVYVNRMRLVKKGDRTLIVLLQSRFRCVLWPAVFDLICFNACADGRYRTTQK